MIKCVFLEDGETKSFGGLPVYVTKNGTPFNKDSVIEYRFYSYNWSDLYYLLFCGKVRLATCQDFVKINSQIEKCGYIHIINKEKGAIL